MRIASILTLSCLLLSNVSFAGDGFSDPKADLYVGRVTDSGFLIEGWKDRRSLIISKGEGAEKVTTIISPDEIVFSKKDGQLVLRYIPNGEYAPKGDYANHRTAQQIETAVPPTAPMPVQPTTPTKDLYLGRYTTNGFLITEKLANGNLVMVKPHGDHSIVKTISPNELIISKRDGNLILHWVPPGEADSCSLALQKASN